MGSVKRKVTLTQSEEYAKYMRIMSNELDMPGLTLGKLYPIKRGEQFVGVGEEMYIVDDYGHNIFQVDLICDVDLYAY